VRFFHVLQKEEYLFIALPMGLLDFLVPFEPRFGIPLFERTIFVLALIALGVTPWVTQDIRKQLGSAASESKVS